MKRLTREDGSTGGQEDGRRMGEWEERRSGGQEDKRLGEWADRPWAQKKNKELFSSRCHMWRECRRLSELNVILPWHHVDQL